MQVMEENEEIAFLYHLVEGYAESSLACHIASLAGLPDELVKRAHQVCAKGIFTYKEELLARSFSFFQFPIIHPVFPQNLAETIFVKCSWEYADI